MAGLVPRESPSAQAVALPSYAGAICTNATRWRLSTCLIQGSALLGVAHPCPAGLRGGIDNLYEPHKEY